MDPTRLIAHRGWQRRFPENTLPALAGALGAGARHVEIDVQLSRDGAPMLFHDHSLDRICHQSGAIHDYTREQLRDFSAYEPLRFGERFLGTPITSLDEVIALLLQHREAHLFLELKAIAVTRFGAEPVCDAVAGAVERLGQRCTLISFSLPVLQAAARRGWRVGPVLNEWTEVHSPTLAALDPQVVFADVVQLPRGELALPWPLAVYEIDQPAQVEALWARGVQWVETFAVGELLGAASA